MIRVTYSTKNYSDESAGPLVMDIADLQRLHAEWQAAGEQCGEYFCALPVLEACALSDYINGLARAAQPPREPRKKRA